MERWVGIEPTNVRNDLLHWRLTAFRVPTRAPQDDDEHEYNKGLKKVNREIKRLTVGWSEV